MHQTACLVCICKLSQLPWQGAFSILTYWPIFDEEHAIFTINMLEFYISRLSVDDFSYDSVCFISNTGLPHFDAWNCNHWPRHAWHSVQVRIHEILPYQALNGLQHKLYFSQFGSYYCFILIVVFCQKVGNQFYTYFYFKEAEVV